ncbi:MAG: hypothetical protein ACR2PK_03845 [Acidimicrobiales bacterium]
MAAIRTEVTEIVTGLAMLGYRELKQALEVRPGHILNVGSEHFDRLEAALQAGRHSQEFETAWSNGQAFGRSVDGLRGRPPWHIEWKGPHRPPGYEQIPADLRIDHVYLVSCKYGSSILHNSSPTHLFDRGLAERRVERGADWFLETAPEAYQALYRAYCSELGLDAMPANVSELDRASRDRIKAASSRGKWPGACEPAAREFALAVAQESANRWTGALTAPAQREEMLWRLLRLQAAPYFVLGADLAGEPLRYRVGTPWDFRESFRLRSFDAWADPAGQPLVRWRADVVDRRSDSRRIVEGHVEIRWSHGRFSGAPEAKVHLDTPPHAVAGYVPLAT